MIYTALDDFYVTPAELEASPSRADGVPAPLEAQLRRYGTDVIADAVILLKLPQAVACTAQVLLHRFYCKRSLSSFDVKTTAAAAFWLAAKLEEVIEIDNPAKLRLRDVLMVFHRACRRRDGKSHLGPPLDPYSAAYDAFKSEVVRAERHMLRAFGFIVAVEHPHRFVLTFGQLLSVPRPVLQEAWNLANDSLRTTLCVRRKAAAVACGLLFLAARRQGVALPESPPWWQVFGVSVEELVEVANEVEAALEAPPANRRLPKRLRQWPMLLKALPLQMDRPFRRLHNRRQSASSSLRSSKSVRKSARDGAAEAATVTVAGTAAAHVHALEAATGGGTATVETIDGVTPAPDLVLGLLAAAGTKIVTAATEVVEMTQETAIDIADEGSDPSAASLELQTSSGVRQQPSSPAPAIARPLNP